MLKSLAEVQETFDDVNEEEEHVAYITVTVVAAFPSEDEYEKAEALKQVNEGGPKPQNYYKFEYQLMPDDTDPTVTEVVSYKTAAKLFPSKQEPKLIKTWEIDNQVWVAWSFTHEIKMTKTKLIKLFEHEFILKIWDSRGEHCSPRTKFDKPKPFRFLQKNGENPEEEVKSLVIKQCNEYLNSLPKELHKKLDRELPTQPKHSDDTETRNEVGSHFTSTLIAVSNKAVASNKIGNKLSDLAQETDTSKHKKHKDDQTTTGSTTSRRVSQTKIDTTTTTLTTKKHHKKSREKSKKELISELEEMRKNGVTNLKMKMKILFAGYKLITARLEKPLSSIEDCFVTVSIENSLMSNSQLELLNPLMIRIDKICDLPNEPVDMNYLKTKCEPVYCSYKFFKEPKYRTKSLDQSKNLVYNDINVYLAGLYDKSELIENLCSSQFNIEIHDRDCRKDQLYKNPSLFGNDPIDPYISNVNMLASVKTNFNPFETKSNKWNPYGIAKLHMHDFLMGEKMLEYYLPVVPCSAPDLLDKNNNADNRRLSGKSNNDTEIIPAGHYLDANTHIYVRVAFSKPIINNKDRYRIQLEETCAFGRMVCIMSYKNISVSKHILDLIRNINAKSLNFAQYPLHVQDAALSTYKLTEEEQKSRTLDIITGFHLLDGKQQVLVLEGLKENGLKHLYESISRKEHDDIRILYNTSISFATRLYSSMDVDLLRIKLCDPIDLIIKKTLLYVRDMAPKPSVEALTKIYQLTLKNLLRDATRCDLFPTAEMVVSMSREFGIPLNSNDIKVLNSAKAKNEHVSNADIEDIKQRSKSSTVSKSWQPLDHHNFNYLQFKSGKSLTRDFQKLNADTISAKSEENRIIKEHTIDEYIINEQDNPVFLYSSQKLNYFDSALDTIRNKNLEDPGIYTYNKEFHNSMTFIPVNVDKLKKSEERLSKMKWLGKHDWINQGFIPSVQANITNKKLDDATVERLKSPWIENEIYANILTSPLDRNCFKWFNRDNDFNLWTKPDPLPNLIYTKPDTSDYETKNKEHGNLKIHRMLPSTEMRTLGNLCSNQLDRLQGLLKDAPLKKSLKTLYVTTHDTYQDSKYKVFKAGDSSTLKIGNEKNNVPFEIERFKQDDFKLIHKVRSKCYKRIAKPLTTEETETFNEHDDFKATNEHVLLSN